jgi:hypothetical protein
MCKLQFNSAPAQAERQVDAGDAYADENGALAALLALAQQTEMDFDLTDSLPSSFSAQQGSSKPPNSKQPQADDNRYFCPFPNCKRSFCELWRLKVHYRRVTSTCRIAAGTVSGCFA